MSQMNPFYALDTMLETHGLANYGLFDLYDILADDQAVTGYGVVLRDRPFTLRQAQNVALALSAVPGTAFFTVKSVTFDTGSSGFYFLHHTGPAHAKLAAIAAMCAEVAA